MWCHHWCVGIKSNCYWVIHYEISYGKQTKFNIFGCLSKFAIDSGVQMLMCVSTYCDAVWVWELSTTMPESAKGENLKVFDLILKFDLNRLNITHECI